MADSGSPQRVIPYLTYDDAPRALSFLVEAFGFEEQSRYLAEDGLIGHASLSLGDTVIYLASAYKEFGFVGPGQLGGVHSQLYCVVDDLDAHYERAKKAGATVVGQPSDHGHGDRVYRALDCEGARWIFASPVTP